MALQLDSDLSNHVRDNEAEMDHSDTSENSASSSENEFVSDDTSDESDSENSLAAARVWREVRHDEAAPPLHMCGVRFAMMKLLPHCTCVA